MGAPPDGDAQPSSAHDAQVTSRVAGLAGSAVALVVAALLLAVQLLGGASSGAGLQPAPAAATTSSTAPDDAADDCSADACGNEHSRAIHAWVKCKAEEGKEACSKPLPPGRALGQEKHAGKAPGPNGTEGNGHAWGRAHAPGQLKAKDKAKHADTDEEAP